MSGIFLLILLLWYVRCGHFEYEYNIVEVCNYRGGSLRTDYAVWRLTSVFSDVAVANCNRDYFYGYQDIEDSIYGGTKHHIYKQSS